MIAEYQQRGWDNRLKVLALGFAFLTIAGEECFDQVVDNLKRLLEVDS